jgi:transcriptional regulator with XRE-family HTH domain
MSWRRHSTSGWGAIIREAREAKGLTQRQLGEAIEMDHGRISRFENEQWTPDLDDVHALCTALGIWPERLLGMLGLGLIPPAAAQVPRELTDAYLEMNNDGRKSLLQVANSLRVTHPR